MSKTSQRAASKKHAAKKAYEQGYNDATTTQWFRWKTHPYLNEYRVGYNAGQRKMFGWER